MISEARTVRQLAEELVVQTAPDRDSVVSVVQAEIERVLNLAWEYADEYSEAQRILERAFPSLDQYTGCRHRNGYTCCGYCPACEEHVESDDRAGEYYDVCNMGHCHVCEHECG